MRPRRLVPAVLGLVLTVLAAPLAGQNEEEDVRRLRVVLAEETVSRLLAVVEDAARDGVPKELLFRKALEGVSKNQSDAVILQTVNQEARDLRAALRVVGRGLEEEALGAASRALRRGADEAMLRSLAREHPADFSMLLLVVEDLSEQGMPAGRAHQLVDEALRRGYRGERIRELPMAMRRLRQDGTSPTEAASMLEGRLRRGEPLVPPARARATGG